MLFVVLFLQKFINILCIMVVRDERIFRKHLEFPHFLIKRLVKGLRFFYAFSMEICTTILYIVIVTMEGIFLKHSEIFAPAN